MKLAEKAEEVEEKAAEEEDRESSGLHHDLYDVSRKTHENERDTYCWIAVPHDPNNAIIAFLFSPIDKNGAPPDKQALFRYLMTLGVTS